MTRIFSTKYFGATTMKGSRIQVRGFDRFGSRSTSYEPFPYAASGGVVGAHEYAVKAAVKLLGLGLTESHAVYDDPVDASRYIHVLTFPE